MADASRENEIGLWEFRGHGNNPPRDWIAATTQEEAVAYYESQTGCTADDYEVAEIGDLDACLFSDLGKDPIAVGRFGLSIYPKMSAREMIRQFHAFPEYIATTEW